MVSGVSFAERCNEDEVLMVLPMALAVDVVFAHRADPTVPMEETVSAFDHLVNTGKAFYWG